MIWCFFKKNAQSKFIIDNGFPLKSGSYPSALHLSLEIVDDHLGAAIVNFMVNEGIDINRQVSIDDMRFVPCIAYIIFIYF